MNKVEVILNRFLDWVEKVLPTAIAAFGLGNKMGAAGKREVARQLLRTKYELEKKENEVKILKAHMVDCDSDEFVELRKRRGPE